MYPAKVLPIRYNFLAGTDTLSLTVYEPIAMQILLGGPPQFWVGVELGDQVWYHAKVLRIRHNLSVGTETPSLSVYEPIAIQILFGGPFPNLGEGLSERMGVLPPESPICSSYNLFAGTETLYLSVYEPIAIQI